MVTGYGAYKIFFYNNQRRHNNVRKGEQPFFYMIHLLDLILIPRKLHEDIPNGY